LYILIHFFYYIQWQSKFHEDFDSEIEQLYPGYCSKILDAAIRSFHKQEFQFGVRLYEVIKRLPFGFKPGTFLQPQVVCMFSFQFIIIIVKLLFVLCNYSLIV
jgi:hypothetical protein